MFWSQLPTFCQWTSLGEYASRLNGIAFFDWMKGVRNPRTALVLKEFSWGVVFLRVKWAIMTQRLYLLFLFSLPYCNGTYKVIWISSVWILPLETKKLTVETSLSSGLSLGSSCLNTIAELADSTTSLRGQSLSWKHGTTRWNIFFADWKSTFLGSKYHFLML